jgi:hypothetical protein
MIYDKKITNAIKDSFVKSKKNAVENAVLVFTKNKTVEYKKLEDVNYENILLKEKLNNFDNQIDELKEEIKKIKSAVEELAVYIDSKRFL